MENGKTLMTRAEAAALRLRVEDVHVPELRTCVRLRELNALQRVQLGEYQATLGDDSPATRSTKLGAWLIAVMAIDEEGTSLFDEPQDVLDRLGGRAVNVLSMAAVRISSLTQEAAEEAIKKSESEPSTASLTG